MNLAAKPEFEQKNLSGIDDVLLTLENLGHDLPRADMEQLNHFNETYLVITRNVRQQLRKGAFQHPDFLQRFDARFAYYYLDAFRKYLQRKDIPPAWKRAFQTARRRKASPMVSMALGVNAHVNNDIPQVLLDSKATMKHYRDYLLVNTIIGKSLDEIIDNFHQPERRLNPTRPLVRFAYKIGMRILIRLWRYSAWRKFQKLRMRHSDVAEVQYNAEKIGKGVGNLPV